jgi:hypothetical protein
MKKFIFLVLYICLFTSELYSVELNIFAKYANDSCNVSYNETIVKYALLQYEGEYVTHHINTQCEYLFRMILQLDAFKGDTNITEDELVEVYLVMFEAFEYASYPGSKLRNQARMGVIKDDELPDLLVFEIDWVVAYEEFLILMDDKYSDEEGDSDEGN